jgi:hypothetical protein
MPPCNGCGVLADVPLVATSRQGQRHVRHVRVRDDVAVCIDDHARAGGALRGEKVRCASNDASGRQVGRREDLDDCRRDKTRKRFGRTAQLFPSGRQGALRSCRCSPDADDNNGEGDPFAVVRTLRTSLATLFVTYVSMILSAVHFRRRASGEGVRRTMNSSGERRNHPSSLTKVSMSGRSVGVPTPRASRGESRGGVGRSRALANVTRSGEELRTTSPLWVREK